MTPSCGPRGEDVRRPSSPPEGIVLRTMKSADVPQVRALHRTLLPVSYPPAFFVQLLLNPRHLCLVATETQTGSVVGFASAAMDVSQPTPSSPPNRSQRDNVRSHISDIPRSRITLLTLGVSPPYQRQGIGRSLVHGVVQRLESSFSSSDIRSCLSVANSEIEDDSDMNEEMNVTKTAVLVQVQVANSNSAGKGFYTNLGMSQRVSDDPRLHFGIGARTSVMAGVICVRLNLPDLSTRSQKGES